MKWDQYITVFVFVGLLTAIGYLNLTQRDLNHRKTKPGYAVRTATSEPKDTIKPNYSKFRMVYEDLKASRDITNEMYEDHFSLESDFFGIFQYFESNLYGTNPIPEKVLEGDDGYLFLGDDFSKAFSESKGYERFRRGHFRLIQPQLCSKRWWLEHQNIAYYVAVVPNKLTVYDEKIPIRKSSPETKRVQTVNFFDDAENPIIDVTPTLLDRKEEGLYFKTDTHWNELGAFYAYVELMKHIQKDFPQTRILELSDFNRSQTVSFQNDQTRMLQTQRKEVAPQLNLKSPRGKEVAKILCVPDYYRQDFTIYDYRYQSDVNDLKVLLLGDSFGAWWRNYLKESFGEVIVVRHNRFDPDLIASVQPDIVINEFVERNIEELMVKPSRLLEEDTANPSGE